MAEPSDPTELRPRQPSDVWVERFARACAFGGVFELRIRMLAERTPALKRDALKADLTPLCRSIVGHYAAKLASEDRALLVALPGIRNKLLHVEFSRAVGRIKPFSEELRDAEVLKADLVTGDVVSVPQSSTEDGTLFGWLLESARSGAFDSGAELFRRGITLAEMLLSFHDGDVAGVTPNERDPRDELRSRLVVAEAGVKGQGSAMPETETKTFEIRVVPEIPADFPSWADPEVATVDSLLVQLLLARRTLRDPAFGDGARATIERARQALVPFGTALRRVTVRHEMLVHVLDVAADLQRDRKAQFAEAERQAKKSGGAMPMDSATTHEAIVDEATALARTLIRDAMAVEIDRQTARLAVALWPQAKRREARTAAVRGLARALDCDSRALMSLLRQARKRLADRRNGTA
jgi:hypothetical protein